MERSLKHNKCAPCLSLNGQSLTHDQSCEAGLLLTVVDCLLFQHSLLIVSPDTCHSEQPIEDGGIPWLERKTDGTLCCFYF